MALRWTRSEDGRTVSIKVKALAIGGTALLVSIGAGVGTAYMLGNGQVGGTATDGATSTIGADLAAQTAGAMAPLHVTTSRTKGSSAGTATAAGQASTATDGTAATSGGGSSSAQDQGGSASQSKKENKVVALVNEARADAGCEPLTVDVTLAAVAHAHSKDMATSDYFDHNGQDGTTPFERFTSAGYDYSTAGENIAAGQQTAAEVVEAWMNSENHRENILNCSFTEIGVGRYVDANSTYGVYWTQDFGTPKA